MNNFSSPLWKGRMVGLLLDIAYRKGIRYNTSDEITIISLYAKASSVASTEEMEVVNGLMKIYADRKSQEEAGGIVISQGDDTELQKRGQQEVRIVYQKFRSYLKLMDEEDFFQEEEKRIAAEKARQKRKNIYILTGIAVVVLGIIIYNSSFVQEYKAYRKAIKSTDDFFCECYYEDYPQGRHYEEVLYHDIKCSERPVKELTDYMYRFPEGKYVSECEGAYSTLWDEEIAKYVNRKKGNESPEAVTYVLEMLKYMKTNRIHTVLVKNISHIVLKDFSEYSQSMRELAEQIGATPRLSVEGHMISLKENFMEGDREVLADILSKGVEKSFARMFNSDLINVVSSESDAQEGSPVLSFDYTISNQEIMGIPSLWTYTTNGVPKSYLLGISIDFVADFTIPDSDVTYRYSESGEPAGEINGIMNIKDGYRRMTQMCFAKFSNVMADNLGLDQYYFRGE